MKRTKNPLADLATFRKSLGENQSQFWGRFGVTQSGGSRYETGRSLPLPVAILVLAFAEAHLSDKVLKRLRLIADC